jgi:hypothetical protein
MENTIQDVFEVYLNGNISRFRHIFIFAKNSVKKEIILFAFNYFYDKTNAKKEFEKFLRTAYH